MILTQVTFAAAPLFGVHSEGKSSVLALLISIPLKASPGASPRTQAPKRQTARNRSRVYRNEARPYRHLVSAVARVRNSRVREVGTIITFNHLMLAPKPPGGGGGWGDSHIKLTGMLVDIFKRNP